MIAANDTANGAYLYDFGLQTFLYTSPALYPYLYNFSAGAFYYFFSGNMDPASRVVLQLRHGAVRQFRQLTRRAPGKSRLMTALPGAPTESDWQMLGRLFADGMAAFRHRMGVSRSRFSVFYAPTWEAAAIRAEKEAVLRLPDAAQYLVETVAGETAL